MLAASGGPWLPPSFSFLSGLPTPARKRRLILTIQTFVDESGFSGQGLSLVLAGVISNTARWAEFSDAWRAALEIPPRLEYFKTREAVRLIGQFTGWKRKARDERLRLLARILKRSGPKVILTSIDLEAHREIFGKFGIIPWRDPYFLPYHEMILGVSRDVFRAGLRKERFEIIFDEQEIFGRRAKAWYQIFKEDQAPKIQAIMPLEPMFRDDKEFLPLQASDLLAWCFRRRQNDMSDPLGWLIRDELGDLEYSSESLAFTRERLSYIMAQSRRVKISPESARAILRQFDLHEGRDFRAR